MHILPKITIGVNCLTTVLMEIPPPSFQHLKQLTSSESTKNACLEGKRFFVSVFTTNEMYIATG
jgi:hypothetical protein